MVYKHYYIIFIGVFVNRKKKILTGSSWALIFFRFELKIRKHDIS